MLNQLAAFELKFSIGSACNVLVVGDHHNGLAILMKLPKDIEDLFACGFV